ncbi:DUF1648 domain-containing protein [Streptomyces sp. NPDC057654]|uniref:DUF1648 domain-containing protein n=1 Tax=Streptomyces sp. NPDC057654 TaxID=3346196 RepID=UPI0036A7F45E
MTGSRASAPTATHRSPWAAAFAALPFLAGALVVAGVYTALHARLPDPMATHFGSGGKPDGFTSLGAILWVPLVMTLVTGAVFASLHFFAGGPPRAQRGFMAISYAVAVLLNYLSCAFLYAGVDVADGADMRFPIWRQLPLALAAAAVAAAIGWFITRFGPPAPRPAPQDAHAPQAARLGLAADERAAWTRTIGSLSLALLGVAAACAGIVLMATVGGWPGVPPLLLGLTAALFGSVRVTVDQDGLRLAPRVLPLPRIHIPLSRIEEAHACDIRVFRDFGGWGYRVRPGRSGVVLRSGEAISLRLATGSEFVVTTGDADTAAGLLNTLIDRRPTPSGPGGSRS